MFKKLLIANRGEIARRISHVAQEMGVKTVAVYSDADADLPFVKEANESVRIGPPPPKESYLNVNAIVEAAKKTGADAVHPGYGFLSENSDFARAVTSAGVAWVGPPPEAMLRMKDKAQARKLVAAAGVPIIPGSADVVPDIHAAMAEAERIGFPILCKAAGGGGGIGMTVANSASELEKSLRASMDRAKSAFGREGVYLERYFADTRHLEVQILGDTHGHLIHVLERECSIQRRHQKVVEEAGSPLFLDGKNAALKQKLFDAGVAAAKSFGYANAGTVECLYADGEIYFIEMNARLQVEHPVTELTTGMNLIAWQLKIAAGEKLTVKQEDVKRTGHALEFRIYAEDPVKFFPSPGPLNVFRAPTGTGIRLDSGYEQGNIVTPNYDPMIAKLIVTADNRTQAISRAIGALDEFHIEGIKHNIPLHKRILASEVFQSGHLNTRFLENHAKPSINS
jgi:acetyl-CoA carboxylase, biotin carboxylase subunit